MDALSRDTETERAQIGEHTKLEPNVVVGYQYHPDAGPALIGHNTILRGGTVIYGDVVLGGWFQSGHNTIIRAKVKTGDHCTVSNNSTIEGIARLGSGVRIMSHVYVPTRTWFGDDVFVGPGVVMLNDKRPGRAESMPIPRGPTIEDDVVIGGGCVIHPGITIGERSFIAAGAVVTKDVPPRSLVLGSPGKISPLPDHLDRKNHKDLTRQPVDLWHPATPDLAGVDWPEDWPPER